MTGQQLNALCLLAKIDAQSGLPPRKFQLADMQAYYDAEYSRYMGEQS
jgi:hypothetical protein